MSMGIRLSERTISAFPLSVGTSLALESLFTGSLSPIDPDRKFDHVEPSIYGDMWFNLSTLFRNLVGAASKHAFTNASISEFTDAMLAEIEVINSVFSANGTCVPVFYVNSYPYLEKLKKGKKVVLRGMNTGNQLFYLDRHDKTIDAIERVTDSIRKFTGTITPTIRTKSLILTHIPFDLLSRNRFERLDLLESHTGVLKDRTMWGSKLYQFGTMGLNHMPFNIITLIVFGDKVQISPSLGKLREQVYETSIKRHWTPLTTIDKIKMDLSLDIKEPYVLSWLKSL